jgi:hypothetical protein
MPASNGIEHRAMNPYSNHQPVDEDLVQRLREKEACEMATHLHHRPRAAEEIPCS